MTDQSRKDFILSILPIIEEVCAEVNDMTLEEQHSEWKALNTS